MVTTVVSNSNKIAGIVDAIFAAVPPFATRVNTRTDTLGKLAATSSALDWSLGDIALAMPSVLKKANNLESQKALNTFAADARCAMHPNVRSRFPALRRLINDAWEVEKVYPKGEVRPLAHAFGREYHALKSAMIAVRDETVILNGPSDVVFWAKANDPDFSPAKVAKKIEHHGRRHRQDRGELSDRHVLVDHRVPG